MVYRILLVGAAFVAASHPAIASEKKDGAPAKSDLVEKVEVAGDVARDRVDAATFTDLDREAIESRNRGQDLGMLLGETVNAYAYSDAGNGVGYSYLSLRGFNQQRIAVAVNGVPLNTPENRSVYYIDLADFAGGLDLVQVQRGPGTSLGGAPAVGGAVDLETGNLSLVEGGRLELGAGSYGTVRTSLSYGGPLAGGRWAWSARVARVRSDGYRDPSWTRHALYSIGLQRYGDGSIWKILLFGGPERTQLAYYGVPRECLDGSADTCDRRTNFLRDGETDSFVQPQLQVIHDRRIREGLFLHETAYAIVGRGYYRQYAATYDYRPTGFEAPTAELPELSLADTWRRRALYNRQVGWLPRVSWDHAGGSLTAGAELTFHRGEHRGEITDGLVCTGAGADPCDVTEPLAGDPLLYAYDNTKKTYTLFARERLSPSSSVAVDLELQATRHEYAMRNDRVRGYSYDASYDFLSPRVGANWNVTDRWNVYARAAAGKSEPYFSNVWDPEDAYADPRALFAGLDPASRRLTDPGARPETYRSVEAGFGWRDGADRLKANVYRIDFRDEFVYAGGLDEDGVPITTNAGRSVHEGVELEGAFRLPGEIDLSGYAAFSRDVLKRYVLLDGPLPLDWSGNRVALFPDSMARVAVARAFGAVRLEASARRVGTIYTDNSENERKDPAARETPGYVPKKVDPHTVVDLAGSVSLPRRLTVRVWVRNALDREYETIGYSYGTYSEFFPAAGRNLFASVAWDF